ncbi:hypothetical protein B0T17DRAFT_82835 [Bombardia bombarda]|uniref:Ecp2 effector protein-like domain-containing protein n=1 Tax=Bombardia bombarda TaxID=252184 RepID=A0AA40CFD7_9PEZI|nr:hypothetical protein B0T17DRAFT_82835 [Bombardia bombarda]
MAIHTMALVAILLTAISPCTALTAVMDHAHNLPPSRTAANQRFVLPSAAVDRRSDLSPPAPKSAANFSSMFEHRHASLPPRHSSTFVDDRQLSEFCTDLETTPSTIFQVDNGMPLVDSAKKRHCEMLADYFAARQGYWFVETDMVDQYTGGWVELGRQMSCALSVSRADGKLGAFIIGTADVGVIINKALTLGDFPDDLTLMNTVFGQRACTPDALSILSGPLGIAANANSNTTTTTTNNDGSGANDQSAANSPNADSDNKPANKSITVEHAQVRWRVGPADGGLDFPPTFPPRVASARAARRLPAVPAPLLVSWLLVLLRLSCLFWFWHNLYRVSLEGRGIMAGAGAGVESCVG